MAKPEWITIGTVEGSMNGSSEITAAAHTGRVAREGTITGTTAGGATDTTAVSQVGAAEVITVEKKTYTAAAVGQKVTIQGKSNSATLYLIIDNPGMIQSPELAIAGVKDTTWDGVENTQVTGDPGADAIYDFTLTVTVPENLLESTLVAKFSINNANDTVTSGEITVNQAAGVKNYAIPTISAFAYPGGNIPASGGSKTPTLSYSQTWGWNESNTNGGTISGTLAAPASGTTFAFSGAVVDATTGVVTAASKGTTVSDVTEVDAVTVTVTLNGQTSASSASVSVKQAANTASYGDIDFVGVPSADDIPSSGGMISVPNIKWSTGVRATQTISYTSGSEVIGTDNDGISGVKPTSINIRSDKERIVAESKGTAVSARTEVGVFVFTATGAGGKTATKSLTIYQGANSATYGEVTIGQATPVSLAAPGETYTIVPAMKQTVTYTSGATRTEATPADNKVQLSANYVVKTAKEGFSLETNTGKVTVSPNPTNAPRNGFVVTISAEGEGGKTATKDITFNQQGSASTIDISPNTLSFIAAGETKTVTITSNDSWTLS